MRPVKVLSTIDRIVYQSICNKDIIGKTIDSQLQDNCIANRISGNQKEYFKKYNKSWDDFHIQQHKDFKLGKKYRIELDIQGFFENIIIEKLIRKLRDDFNIDNNILEILDKQLGEWVEFKELKKGIPQGPDASWLLANAYLDSFDKFVKKIIFRKNISYYRYADDIVFMGTDGDGLKKIIEEIILHLRGDGLVLNEKTKITHLKSKKELEENMFLPYPVRVMCRPRERYYPQSVRTTL
jgi:retron-type reverse transcriptase